MSQELDISVDQGEEEIAAAIREVRHRISERFGHDPYRLVAYLMELQKEHPEKLPDPKRLLLGSGTQTRFIQVEAASQLAHPDVEALIAATIDQARVSSPSTGKGSLIIKSEGAKKRPLRKPSK